MPTSYSTREQMSACVPMEGSIWTLLTVSWQLYVSSNKDLCCRSKHALNISGTPVPQSTKNTYPCTLEGFQVYIHTHHMYMYFQATGKWNSVSLFTGWPLNMYFVQSSTLYTFAEMSCGKTWPDLDIYAQLYIAIQGPYALSVL